VDLLDMAIKAKNIFEEKTRIANNYDNAPIENWYKSLYTASDFKKEADKYKLVYERILKSYESVMITAIILNNNEIMVLFLILIATTILFLYLIRKVLDSFKDNDELY
jgi:hypothetical protein